MDYEPTALTELRHSALLSYRSAGRTRTGDLMGHEPSGLPTFPPRNVEFTRSRSRIRTSTLGTRSRYPAKLDESGPRSPPWTRTRNFSVNSRAQLPVVLARNAYSIRGSNPCWQFEGLLCYHLHQSSIQLNEVLSLGAISLSHGHSKHAVIVADTGRIHKAGSRPTLCSSLRRLGGTGSHDRTHTGAGRSANGRPSHPRPRNQRSWSRPLA